MCPPPTKRWRMGHTKHVETATPAAGAGTSLSKAEHDAAVAKLVSTYGPFPRLVTDEFELLKYLRGLDGLADAAVLQRRYSILVVRPRTSMPDDAQLHTIDHAAASADRDQILGAFLPPAHVFGNRAARRTLTLQPTFAVIVDNGWDAATGAHRMPYAKGWFIAEPEFATIREYDPVSGIVTAVYEENALLRDPINRKAPFPAPPREISVLVEQLHADNVRRNVLAKKTKLTAAEKRELSELKANVSGTFFSPYVRKTPRPEPLCIGIIKTAVYDIDPGRHTRYNAKANAVAALKSGRVVLPMLDQLFTEATGSPWTYATGEERTTAVRAYMAPEEDAEEDEPPPIADRARRWSTVMDDDEEPTCSMPFLVGDILTVPPEWLVRTTKTREGTMQVRYAIPIGGGRCAIPESVALKDLRYLMQHHITTVALLYGGPPSETIPHPRYANMRAFRPTTDILHRINREIKSGAITRRPIDDPYRRMACILVASSTRQQQRQLNMMYATAGPSTATLGTRPFFAFRTHCRLVHRSNRPPSHRPAVHHVRDRQQDCTAPTAQERHPSRVVRGHWGVGGRRLDHRGHRGHAQGHHQRGEDPRGAEPAQDGTPEPEAIFVLQAEECTIRRHRVDVHVPGRRRQPWRQRARLHGAPDASRGGCDRPHIGVAGRDLARHHPQVTARIPYSGVYCTY